MRINFLLSYRLYDLPYLILTIQFWCLGYCHCPCIRVGNTRLSLILRRQLSLSKGLIYVSILLVIFPKYSIFIFCSQCRLEKYLIFTMIKFLLWCESKTIQWLKAMFFIDSKKKLSTMLIGRNYYVIIMNKNKNILQVLLEKGSEWENR